MNAGTIRNAGGKINKAVPEYKPDREPVRGKVDFYRLTNAAKKKKIGGSMNEVIDVTNNNDVPAIADDQLLAIARQAAARIDAVIKIKQLALKVTNASDWTDQQGKPYLQASGSEKVANLFNISWRIDEPTMEEETDGAITYIYKGAFSLGGRTIEVEGSRSSRDEFFKKYEWKNGQKVGEKPLDRRDLKMAAMTNLLGNGITRILGIRNLTWEDLEQYAKIKKEQVSRVEYKTKGENKQPLKEPQKKAPAKKEAAQVVTIKVASVASKSGEKDGKPYKVYTIFDDSDVKYGTFSDTFADLANSAKEKGLPVKITFTVGQYGNKITNLEIAKAA